MKRSTGGTQPKGLNVKRSKLADARFIEVESPALSNGAVDLKKFIESRSFEITALQDAMKRSKESSAQRAFQALPRCLRRRAASHNIKRIPKGLRDRALYEMQLSSSSTLPIAPSRQRLKRFIKRLRRKLAKSGETKAIDSTGSLVTDNSTDDSRIPSLAAVKLIRGKFAGRQLRKVWLPTHLWVCKRAHMIHAWGYAIPEKPTEKSYRPTHRAAFRKDAIAFDMSYEPLFCISGPYEALKEKFGNSFANGLPPVFLNSSRSFTSYLVKSDIHELICPCFLQWNNPTEDDKKQIPVKNPTECVQLVIRLHPSAFLQAWNYLSGIAVLDDRIAMHDWRLDLASFDIHGPDSNIMLHKVFDDVELDEAGKVWQSISNYSSACLPMGASISVKALVNTRCDKNLSEKGEKSLLDSAENSLPASANQYSTHFRYWERQEIPSFAVFENKNRHTHEKKSSEKEVIPVYITYRKEWNGLTVILPWDYAKFVWRKMMYQKGIRFGGLENLHQIAFEKRMPFFPIDYPDTISGQLCEEERKKRNEDSWKRRPPAKRVNYQKFGDNFSEIGNPFCCDWVYLNEIVKASRDEDKTLQLVRVQVQLVQRGSLQDRARIYCLSDDELSKWKTIIYKENLTAENLLYPKCPNETAIIGFVTTGNFNLNAGKPSGIANVLAKTIKNEKSGYCIIRNVGCSVPRLAQWKFNQSH